MPHYYLLCVIRLQNASSHRLRVMLLLLLLYEHLLLKEGPGCGYFLLGVGQVRVGGLLIKYGREHAVLRCLSNQRSCTYSVR